MMNTDIAEIKVTKTEKSRINEVDFDNIKFGREFSDHMFSMDYKDGQWQNLEITPYRNLSFSPAMSALHYGQSIFEGLKAYREGDDILTFRAKDNFARMNRSAQRMCIPQIPEEIVGHALKKLLELDAKWVPAGDSNSLYIRPFLFATDEYVGIKPSDTYKFIIFTCPVGNYYSEPLKVKIESHYTRAANGGVGEAKCAGNYAASLYPARMAQQKGYHQLVWTDGKEHKYIEESGTMNIMFVIGDKLITPALTGTILPGITRDSVLTIAKDWGYQVEERPVTVDEIINAAKDGSLKEAFGAGTAATIANIKLIGHDSGDYELPPFETREFSNRIYDYFNRLKRGKEDDKWGWIERI